MSSFKRLLAGTVCCLLLYTGHAMASDKPLQPAGLEVTTYLGDNQTFTQGDIISFLLTLDRDAYITAIYVDASGQSYQVVPNAEQADNFYQADLFIPLPANDAGFQFRVDAPYGKETLYVFASDRQTALPGKPRQNGLLKPDWPLARIRNAIRQQSSQYFDEASVSLRTQTRTATH